MSNQNDTTHKMVQDRKNSDDFHVRNDRDRQTQERPANNEKTKKE